MDIRMISRHAEKKSEGAWTGKEGLARHWGTLCWCRSYLAPTPFYRLMVTTRRGRILANTPPIILCRKSMHSGYLTSQSMADDAIQTVLTSPGALNRSGIRSCQKRVWFRATTVGHQRPKSVKLKDEAIEANSLGSPRLCGASMLLLPGNRGMCRGQPISCSSRR